MQEQLSMARVCSLWPAKLSATSGVLNTNTVHAFLCIWLCVCVYLCVRVQVRGNQVSYYGQF